MNWRCHAASRWAIHPLAASLISKPRPHRSDDDLSPVHARSIAQIHQIHSRSSTAQVPGCPCNGHDSRSRRSPDGSWGWLGTEFERPAYSTLSSYQPHRRFEPHFVGEEELPPIHVANQVLLDWLGDERVRICLRGLVVGWRLVVGGLTLMQPSQSAQSE